ncbi:MAG: VOC family protein [Cyclobacteriaceae bacterium]
MKDNSISRRSFLGFSASATALAFLEAHSLLAIGCQQKPATRTNPLIKSIDLLTTTPLDTMRSFYEGVIGFQVLSKSAHRITFQTGLSTLSFEKVSGGSDYRPFYHFAFNIPENKIDQAFEWQKERTPIIHPSPEGSRDTITHFPHWNAHSIFFLDPAGNLVEYIARHDLKNSTTNDFSVDHILYASEIGFVTEDVNKTGIDLMKSLQISEYRPGSSAFWPIGDEMGLLLMMSKGRKWSSHPGQENETNVFKTSVEVNLEKSWRVPGYDYSVWRLTETD